MGMAVDVINAVAAVARALGAVTELKLGIRYVGSAADGTAMDIGRFRCVVVCGERAGELNRGALTLFAPEQTADIDAPGIGEYTKEVFSQKEEITGEDKQRRQIHWEQLKGKQNEQIIYQIDDPKPASLNGNDKQDSELRIGKKGGIGEKQNGIEYTRGDITKEHSVNI